MSARFLNLFTALLFAGLLIAGGCSQDTAGEHWWKTLPEEIPLVMLYHGESLSDVLNDQQTLTLEEFSDFSLAAMRGMKQYIPLSLPLEAIALYPTGSHQLQPVFVVRNSGHDIRDLAQPFRRNFDQNFYRFRNHTIHVLHLQNSRMFATELGQWFIFSKNSVALENGILSFLAEKPALQLTRPPAPENRYLLNTGSLDNWIKLLGAPRYLPRIEHLFTGTGPALMRVTNRHQADRLFHHSIEGEIPLDPDALSGFTSAFSTPASSFDLDRYIPDDAAFFGVYHQPQVPPSAIVTESQSTLDSLILARQDVYEQMFQTLAPPTAFVAFQASGFLSVGETAYLRRLSNPEAFDRILREWSNQGLIEANNEIYHIHSEILGKILGGPFNRYVDFFLVRSGNAAILARRSGLARRIQQDHQRRAVFHYNDEYLRIRQRHPAEVSAWIYSRNRALAEYLEPHLNPTNHARFLSTLTDISTISLIRNTGHLAFQMDHYFTEDRSDPIRDLWVYPLENANITGKPILANIGGGSRDQILVATDNNRVSGIAADGTGFFQVQTGNDRPLGSPVVYDWYGNNQLAVLVAAGNKIYAWNSRGIPLPNFPVRMDENITAPLALADVSRNGRPEMLVATADRKIHVLDQRGENIPGWPQDLNTSATHVPVFGSIDEQSTLWVAAGNALFAFDPDGNRQNHFPVFIESNFGALTLHNRHILAGSSDGHLYAIGPEPLFDDSRITAIQDLPESGEREMEIRRIFTGNSPIVSNPVVETLTTTGENQTGRRETLIAIHNLNGNIFLYNLSGELRLNLNMGQPASSDSYLLITDVNGNGKTDLLATSQTGRVFAWEIESGQPLEHLPAASLRFAVVSDLLANGQTELIGQTRDGLRCWSFRRP